MTRDRKLKLKKVMSVTLATALVTSNLSYANTISTKANINVKNIIGENRYDTSAKISQQMYSSTKANNVIIVNGSAMADGLTATPLASIIDAPILLTTKDSLLKETKDELKRLNPKNVTIIGGESVISQKAVENIKKILPDIKIDRIGGKDRYETSLKIAQAIDTKNDVKKVYIGYGYGEADALSIAAKAGQDKQPIILSQKESLDKDTYEWLKEEELETAYFIGGDANLKDSVINEVNVITKSDIKSNRIAGKDRHETNAKVIEKFYTNDKLNSALVTKSNEMVDALTAGPLASKLKSPIILASQSELSENQKTVLDKKSTEIVYRVGGGISDEVFKEIVLKLTPSQNPSTGGGTGSGGGSKPEPPVNPDNDLLDQNNPKWNIDSDKDGLMDGEEELIGTNPNKSDTDGDGLNDKFELESGLDATKNDSDGNGTLDSDEDLDEDGLKNIDEQRYNTNPIFEDTDGDGLNDNDEINTHNTNPLKSDTDEDGLGDYKEIELGTNPNNKDSDGDRTNDGDEKYDVDIETPVSDKDENVDVNISGSIDGSNIENLYIINMEGTHEFINSDIPGYISAPFRIGNVDENIIEDISITFTLNEDVVKNNEGDEFALYKYNKENQMLEIVSESQKLTYKRGKVFEFSAENIDLGKEYIEYILLNKTKWDEAWSKEMIDPGNESGLLDIVLTIDSSGSMVSNDPSDLRKQESIDFINKLKGKNRAAVVDFDDKVILRQGLTTDKDLLQSAINDIDSDGGTNISKGLRKAIDELDPSGKSKANVDYDKYTIYEGEEENQKNDNLEKVKDIDYIENISTIKDISKQIDSSGRNKFIMLLTDGESTIDSKLIQEAKDKNIKIYTIGLGRGIDSESLENISTETGGKYQYGETAEDFEEIFKELEDGTINLIQDTDGDGIPDYFEENMRLVGGIFIKLDPKKKDTDKDGIDDGEEITGKKNPTAEDFHNMYIKEQKAFKYQSRPDLVDTDDDGISDKDDKTPNKVNVSDLMLLESSDFSYYEKYEIGKKLNTIDYTLSNGKKLKNSNIKNWSIIDQQNGRFGLGYIVLKSGNKAIIAFTGSNPDIWADLGDWIGDGITTVRPHPQANNAKMATINIFEEELEGIDEVYITGHSLGGLLTQNAVYEIKNSYNSKEYTSKFVRAVTFNSANFTNPKHLLGSTALPLVEEIFKDNVEKLIKSLKKLDETVLKNEYAILEKKVVNHGDGLIDENSDLWNRFSDGFSDIHNYVVDADPLYAIVGGTYLGNKPEVIPSKYTPGVNNDGFIPHSLKHIYEYYKFNY